MFDLLQPRLSDLTLAKRRLVRLLDKAMQHDDSFGDQRTYKSMLTPDPQRVIEAAGVKSVPALVMNGAAFHINFGAGIDALK
jgi:hypothetical protein